MPVNSEHPMFCVCDACSAKVAQEHWDGDEKLGRDWRNGDGCGCAACRGYRKVLDGIDASFARVKSLQDDLARIRKLKGLLP